MKIIDPLNLQDCIGARARVCKLVLIGFLRKIDTTSFLCRGWPDFDTIWQVDAGQYADYEDKVEIETASKILMWRTLVFPNRRAIPTKFNLLIDFGLLKTATSPNTKPEVVLRRRGCHLENR